MARPALRRIYNTPGQWVLTISAVLTERSVASPLVGVSSECLGDRTKLVTGLPSVREFSECLGDRTKLVAGLPKLVGFLRDFLGILSGLGRLKMVRVLLKLTTVCREFRGALRVFVLILLDLIGMVERRLGGRWIFGF